MKTKDEIKINKLRHNVLKKKGVSLRCFFCKRMLSNRGAPNRSGLCSGCRNSLDKNNLKGIIDIYLKRKRHDMLKRKDKEK